MSDPAPILPSNQRALADTAGGNLRSAPPPRRSGHGISGPQPIMYFQTLDVHASAPPLSISGRLGRFCVLRRKSDATQALDQSPMAEAPIGVDGHSMSVGMRDKNGEGKPRSNV